MADVEFLCATDGKLSTIFLKTWGNAPLENTPLTESTITLVMSHRIANGQRQSSKTEIAETTFSIPAMASPQRYQSFARLMDANTRPFT